MTMRRGGRVHLGLRRRIGRAGAHPYDRHVGDASRRRLSVVTTEGEIRCRCVVLASGGCSVPERAGGERRCAAGIDQITPFDYRSPSQLPDGGVLVVGASATGAAARRRDPPIGAAGDARGRRARAAAAHVPRPRRAVVDGASGVWDQRYDEIDDLTRARRLPSPQLVGAPGTTLDLNALTATGVELVGRVSAVRDGWALFSGGLRNMFALADLKMNRLLDTFDEWARDEADARRAGTLRADACARIVARPARSRQRRDPDDPLGDRLPPGLQLAPCARRGREGAGAARRGRRRRQPRDGGARAARVAPSQIELHQRCRGRCARAGRSPRGLSRAARPEPTPPRKAPFGAQARRSV